MLFSSRFIFVAVATLSASSLRAVNVTFSDGTFNSAEWTSSVTTAGTASATASTSASGGNPGSYRGVSLTVAPSSSALDVELWNLAVYDPANQGRVQSVAVSYDVTRISSTNAGATQVAKCFAVRQGGTTYTTLLGVSVVTPPAWDSASIANIVPLFPLVNWTNGGPITFGLCDSVSASGVGFTIVGGYDNFLVQVTSSETYYFPQIALGSGFQTILTYINYSPRTVTCVTNFYSDTGTPLMIPFKGGTVATRTDTLQPGQAIHDQSVADLTAPVAQGWAQASCTGPIKASALYRFYQSGAPAGEAGVNASTDPAGKFVTFAEVRTGVAYANPSTTQSALITITVISSAGQRLGSTNINLGPLAHGSANLGPLLGLQNFVGFVQITSSIPIISLSLNAEVFPVFSSLPPGDLSNPIILVSP